MVDKVGTLLAEKPDYTKKRFDEIASIVMSIWKLLKSENVDVHIFGKLMLENQECLADLGVSIDQIDNIIDTSLQLGATGGKLTGAGGGGCVILACPASKSAALINTFQEQGLEAFKVKMGIKGIKLKGDMDEG
jgi:mevalonate kinase